MKDVEGQLNLFDEAEQEADVDLKAPAIKVPEHTRKKKRTLEELLKEFHLVMRLFHFLKIRESVMSVVLPLNL
jgi:hypothetical protein